jgi:hypothetical protein
MTPEERRHERYMKMTARLPKRTPKFKGLRFKVLDDGYRA